MSCIPFRNKSLHTKRTTYVSPPIHNIHLYKSTPNFATELRTAKFNFSFLEPCTSKLRFERAELCRRNYGSFTPEIVADVRPTLPKPLVPVKNDQSRIRFPTIMFTKKFPCFCGRQFTICTDLYDCSLLEMLRERAF